VICFSYGIICIRSGNVNLRNIKQTITSIIVSIFLSYILITTNDLFTKIIVIPFLLFGISFFIKNLCLIFNKKQLAKLFSKINVIAFLVYLFGFMIIWCFVSIKNRDYLQILFSIPLWLMGIYIIKKRFFNQKVNSDKKTPKFNFKILISVFLVMIVFLSGIVMMFFGIRDTYNLKVKTKNYITTTGYFNNYDVFDADEDGITYKLTYIYTVDGKEYSITTDYGTNYIPDENSSREIKYNPNNPKEAVITGTNSKNGLIYFGAFFTFGALTFVIAALSVLGYFDKFKIDILGTYIGLLFFIIGIGIILFQTGTTTSLLETIKSFGFLIIIPIMFIVIGIIQTVKCLKRKNN